MKNFLRIAGFLSLLFGGQFTLTAMAQGDLGRVVQGNLDIISRNHIRGDVANLEAQIHSLIYHERYGYGYLDDGYFYGTDQYGRGNRGRVHISPIEVGIGGAMIGGSVDGWRGAAIGGTAGYFGTKAVKAVVQHKRNKREQKEAEAMAAQAQAEAQAMLEKKFFWNDTESVNAGVFYQDNNGTQYVRVGPGQKILLFILPGSNVGVMAEGVVTPSGRTINKEIPYGKGKQFLPANAGWRIFNVQLDKLDW